MQGLFRRLHALFAVHCLVSSRTPSTQASGVSSVTGVLVVLNQAFTQVWADGFFKRVTLESLGLVANLGHSGEPCDVSTETHRVLVIDLSGHHTVRVRFCKCSKSGYLERYRQLLRVDWYPASTLRPQSAYTFDLLDTYHKISLQGKLNLYDFYNAIMQKTDNRGSLRVKVSTSPPVVILCNSLSPESIVTTRCRGVCGSGGTSRTSNEVERATRLLRLTSSMTGLSPSNVLPALIRDETYLRGGILDSPNQRELLLKPPHQHILTGCTCRWLYCLFLAIDANFRLKLKSRGIKDPELGAGLAYFVDPVKFQAHLRNYTQEEEVGLSISFQNITYIFIDRNLRGRVSCSQPSKFKVLEGFFGFRGWRNCLSTRRGSQERRGGPPKG